MTKEQRIASLIQNGITPEDLEKEWYDGYKAGWAKASPGVTKTCYAAFAMALHELHGFGKNRLAHVLNRADNLIIEYLTTEEIIDAVYKNAGLRMNWNDGIETVQVVDDAKPWRRKK